MIDTLLFSVGLSHFVEKAIDLAMDWASKSLFEATVTCPHCGNKQSRSVYNRSDNTFVCSNSNCGNAFVNQYVTVRPETLRSDNSVMSAQAINFRWEIKQHWYDEQPYGYNVITDVLTANSKERDLMLRYSIMKRSTGEVLKLDEIYIAPRKNEQKFANNRVFISANDLPISDENLNLTADIYTAEGVPLHHGINKVLLPDKYKRWSRPRS